MTGTGGVLLWAPSYFVCFCPKNDSEAEDGAEGSLGKGARV